ncbi:MULTISPECIES: SLATT domain-containing protein [Pseudomonas]|uniref:SLATT domain-containing protein n=1 Tax=Pseudomonas rhodesiae TaxID=76760 RepID=A0A8I1EAV9_9PSED|nr:MULTISPECIES: SLATT domain-containing protein [Pseudomonas]MBI6605122.1 SLATT domain-containing protein [Pseudomonas sp. S4_EA_1b]MBI6628212.1 SLATT domain-containing protein [Pseudomonas rhodesiae]
MKPYIAPISTSELVQRWLKRSRESQFAHYYMAEILSSRNRKLGVSTITLTATTGLTSILSAPHDSLIFAIGIASLVAAFLTSLQTFFRYDERATSHLNAGAKYASTRRQLEVIAASGVVPTSVEIENIRKELDSLAERSPNIPKSIFEKAMKKDAA